MHIFISYAKKDTYDLARRIRDELILLPSMTAWMDESIEPAESWAARIQAEIDRCDCVVVLLSPDVNRPTTSAGKRSFVLHEIDYAQSDEVEKPIIPVMAQQTRVPVQLAGIQHIDLTRDPAAGLERLMNEIRRRAGLPLFSPTLTNLTPVKSRRVPLGLLSLGIVLVIAMIAAIILSGVLSEDDDSGNPTNQPESNEATDTPPAPTQVTPLPSVTSIPNDLSEALTRASTPIQSNTEWEPFAWQFEGSDMVLVPQGCFMMGSGEGLPPDEQPAHEQCFTEPFWIDQYEVTRVQYNECVAEGVCTETSASTLSTGDNQPINRVTWFQARDYCIWRGGRLPSEREWEYAARGPDNLIYPWGNDFVPENTVYEENAGNQTADVGSKRAGQSWVGAYDMSGNVWERVSTIYDQDNFPYPYKADGRENLNNNATTRRGFRGGSIDNAEPNELRSAYRNWADPDIPDGYVGIRCVQPSR